MRRGLTAGGVMTAGGGARRSGVMRGYRRAFLRFRSCARLGCSVRCVVRRRRSFLSNSRNRGNDSKTKQDEESARSTRKLSKKTKTIERPWGSPVWHNQSKKLHISMNLAGYTPKSKWRRKYLCAATDLSATAAPFYHLISCSGIVIRSGCPGAMVSSKIERAALEPWQPC